MNHPDLVNYGQPEPFIDNKTTVVLHCVAVENSKIKDQDQKNALFVYFI